jgi:DNA-binding transcriptional LysR family regulator
MNFGLEVGGMEPANLKSFYQVVVSGSFSKAAGQLFISQPALSRQIAALEKELGLQLFYRQSRQVSLTEAGRRLFVYAEKIVGLFNEAQKEMSELINLATGELLIAASTTIANYLFPPVLAAYRQKHDKINISLNVSNSSRIAQVVSERKAEIGLVAGDVRNTDLYQEQFAEDELFLVVPTGHVLTKSHHITPRQLSGETFLCREEGSDTQRLISDLFAGLDVEIPQKIILGNTEAIKRGIINHMGISFLSKYTFENELKLGLLVPLKQIKMRRSLLIIYPKGARLSPAALAFTALIKKFFLTDGMKCQT